MQALGRSILSFASFVALIGCGVVSLPSKQSSTRLKAASQATFALWPQISGRVGSYLGHTREIGDMATDGLSMILGACEDTPDEKSVMMSHGMRQIDPYPWALITSACSDYFAGNSASCQISNSTSTSILSQLQVHLEAQKDNNNVVAYYFLDDYPGGDIRAVLQKMHELLVASNRDSSSSFPRPAICGFGGLILPVGDTETNDAGYGFKKSLTNFSPGYCDMVALYPYAVNLGTGPNDPSQFDWSMTYLLPAMLQDLEDHGWEPSAQPLVGVPQTFGYDKAVAPTAADITTQMAAYCKAGAVALIAYSWDDGYSWAHPSIPVTEPFNSVDMRSGLAQGLAACQTYWPGGQE